MDLHHPSLDLVDPTPDIYSLFEQYNRQFFQGELGTVTVEWSKRMTLCAGLCYYQGRAGGCRIKLSEPLLAYRSRGDLVDTLLHEMIHAYLFIKNGYSKLDRDGHGQDFQEIMHRINKAAGTKITVYHTFHDEVDHHRKHWWQCNGPCQHRPPFFGLVKRAMNRAPGPNDNWWADHQANCNGNFIKIKEPEKPLKKKEEGKTKQLLNKSGKGTKDITSFFKKVDKNEQENVVPGTSGQSNQQVITLDSDDDEDLKLAIAMSLREAGENENLDQKASSSSHHLARGSGSSFEPMEVPYAYCRTVGDNVVPSVDISPSGTGSLTSEITARSQPKSISSATNVFSSMSASSDPRFPGAGYRLGGSTPN